MSSDSASSEALYSGEALQPDALSSITSRDETTVVLLAGPVKCGKTTVVVGLYELFNEGPVGGLLFGGSATLAGFERICHAGRTASGLPAADTLRTNPSSGTAFLHLRVADTARTTPKTSSLLISDVTGEAFDEARDVSEPLIIPRALWRRADVICLALDGDKLSKPTQREIVRTDARNLLRAARESGLISRQCKLVLVTTKWDLITTPGSEQFVAETEESLRAQFGKDYRNVAIHRIAARPTSSRISYAYGLPGLLTEWIARSPSEQPIVRPVPVPESGVSEFAQIAWTRLTNKIAGGLDAI